MPPCLQVIMHHLGDLKKAKDYLEFLADADLPACGLPYSVFYAELVACT